MIAPKKCKYKKILSLKKSKLKLSKKGAALNEKILIVDDETEIADLVEVYLQNEGYQVYKFYNALDALACVDEKETDLAILDVMLPDLDGFTLCRKIREKHLFPIIMLPSVP